MKRIHVIACLVALALLVVLFIAWPRTLQSQPDYQQSQARDFAMINKKLDQIVAGQGRIMSLLDRVWQDTRRRR